MFFFPFSLGSITMTLLCFLLDLQSLSPALLRDLKQSLLQLANLYAVSSGRGERDPADEATALRDRIGLCYLQKNRSLLSDELMISYSPRRDFNLRDFHHAINNLPMDCFLPEWSDSHFIGNSGPEVTFGRLMSNEALYSWGGKDVSKKVIFIGSSLVTNTEALRKTLLDAAEQCISVEFIVLEQDHFPDFSEKLQRFVNSISDLENCLLRTYFPSTSVLCGLVKRWLLDLKNDVEEPLQAVFLFKNNIIGSTNQIFCNLFTSYNHILDGFKSCKTCRCHGHPIKSAVANYKTKMSSFCPVTCCELGACDLIENVVKVGEQTVLFMPSFQGCPELRRITEPINLNIIERTNLATLSEGLIVGASYVVTPASCHEMEAISDEFDKTELNNQLFHGLCRALSLLDQGLVCSSSCNTETLTDATFQCFYVLQPSDRGPMLLRRLAASEEILPIPEVMASNDMTLPEEIDNSIQASLSKVQLRDYNPLLHERGFHPKLNLLVKESLQFGSIPIKKVQKSPKFSNTLEFGALLLPQLPTTQPCEEGEEMQPSSEKEENISCVTEEWEDLLVVNEMKESYSTTCISKPKFENLILSSQSKPIDEKTSRILERLEAPKQRKSMGTLPIVSSNVVNGPMKKPQVSLGSSLSMSQPLKPSFLRLKRKQM